MKIRQAFDNFTLQFSLVETKALIQYKDDILPVLEIPLWR